MTIFAFGDALPYTNDLPVEKKIEYKKETVMQP